MAGRLEGKVAFITGAARGQGRAHAVRMASEGADIIALDNNKRAASTAYDGPTAADLEETARLVEAQGRRIVAREADVRDLEAQQAVVREGVAELGRLDIVVANAGICSANPSWEITVEQWQETIDINLTGVFYTAKATVPLLIEQGQGGSIIITSSVAGLRGLPFLGHYVASKHAIVGLAKTMANELGQHNIRVNTLHPHGVATGMDVSDLRPFLAEHASTLAPIFMQTLPEPVSQPEDMAAAVAWLASDDARHVTGIQLPVDLGTMIR
ncbi:mycofactocin-coupled SDR family oxidoreductase [Blastococcus sp. SYSU D00820]